MVDPGCRPVWHCDGDVRLLLDALIEAGVCKGQASLLVFTSNTINLDVPLENIVAMHEAVEDYTS